MTTGIFKAYLSSFLLVYLCLQVGCTSASPEPRVIPARQAYEGAGEEAVPVVTIRSRAWGVRHPRAQLSYPRWLNERLAELLVESGVFDEVQTDYLKYAEGPYIEFLYEIHQYTKFRQDSVHRFIFRVHEKGKDLAEFAYTEDVLLGPLDMFRGPSVNRDTLLRKAVGAFVHDYAGE